MADPTLDSKLDPTLHECYNLFKLNSDATIHDLDKRYQDFTEEIAKKKPSEPELAKEKEKQVESAYGVLTDHFIRMEIQNKQYRPTRQFSYDSIARRRHEAGPVRGESSTNFGTVTDSHQPPRSVEERLYENLRLGSMGRMQMEEDNDDETSVVLGGRQYDYTEMRSRPRTPTTNVFTLIDSECDIFDAPDNAVIVHAVNCLGVWGSGFAAEVKLRFPAAYIEYQTYCHSVDVPGLLVGDCLLIPPQRGDYNILGRIHPKRWIACLFTSVGYGKGSADGINPGKDAADTIEMNTDSALVDLRNQLFRYRNEAEDDRPGEIYSPKFNAGRFGVLWSNTARMIAVCFAGYQQNWTVVRDPADTGE